MKRIVTLALMMLLGGYEYGAAQAAATAVADQEKAAQMEATRIEAAQKEATAKAEDTAQTEGATNDFLGLKWGAGIGVIGGFGGDRAVEKASIVNNAVRVEEEGDLRPHVFLEMHAFLANPAAKEWRRHQQQKAKWKATPEGPGKSLEAPVMSDPPLMGVGPFVALQSGDNKTIDSLAVGVMWGVRNDPKKSASVNIGIGLSFNPSVQVLGGGLKDGRPMPTDETEIRFKKKSQFGWALMTSFTF